MIGVDMKIPKTWKVDDEDWVASDLDLQRVRRIRRNRRIDAFSRIVAVVLWASVFVAAYYWLFWS